jgi:hypothetical protein
MYIAIEWVFYASYISCSSRTDIHIGTCTHPSMPVTGGGRRYGRQVHGMRLHQLGGEGQHPRLPASRVQGTSPSGGAGWAGLGARDTRSWRHRTLAAEQVNDGTYAQRGKRIFKTALLNIISMPCTSSFPGYSACPEFFAVHVTLCAGRGRWSEWDLRVPGKMNVAAITVAEDP